MKYEISFTSANPAQQKHCCVETDGIASARALYAALQVSGDVREVRLYEDGFLIDETKKVEYCKWRPSK
jgi:hypothetical protein